MSNTFNKKTLYTYKFIDQCLPIFAFYTILFIERGKSLGDIALLIAFWSAFSIIAEVPAGVLADRWNRRNMLALASMLQGICFIIWFFSHSFLMFALGFAFWGISGAFSTGTAEALIYDNLKHDGAEDTFVKVYGKAQFYANAGTIVGIASAGVLIGFIDIPAIAILSAAICFFNAGLALKIREMNYYAENQDEDNKKRFTALLITVKEALIFLRERPVAFISVIFMVMIASLGGYLDEFDALIIYDWELSYVWVSVILTIRFAFVALGDILAPYVQQKVHTVKNIFLLGITASLILVVFAALWNPYALIVFGIAFLIFAVSEVLLVNVLQNEIRQEGRVTIMSFYGIGQNIGMILFALIFALLSGIFNLSQVYLLIALYGAIVAAIMYLLVKLWKIK